MVVKALIFLLVAAGLFLAWSLSKGPSRSFGTRTVEPPPPPPAPPPMVPASSPSTIPQMRTPAGAWMYRR